MLSYVFPLIAILHGLPDVVGAQPWWCAQIICTVLTCWESHPLHIASEPVVGVSPAATRHPKLLDESHGLQD